MRVISSHFPRHIIASLRHVDVWSLTPLHAKLLVTEVDTRTMPLCGARAVDLNRQERKVGVEKVNT